MKQWVKPIGAFVGAVVVLGGLILVSGIVPIEASSGHWPVTRWFLEFAKVRSVSTHSLFIEVPPLDDPGLVRLGAGAYHTNCVMCHGHPGYEAPVVAGAMTPEPPYLPDVLHKYAAGELFYIVRHGIKFAGMPGWPVRHREDEVWPVVAFLQQLPKLDRQGYQALVWGEDREDTAATAAGLSEVLSTDSPHLATCMRCHGAEGNGRGQPAFPVLAGQSRGYLLNALEAYASGNRASGMMQPVAAPLSREEMQALAGYFASQPRRPAESNAHRQAMVAEGERIALEGDPSRRVPSCIDCHTPGGAERRDAYPILDGQPADYLIRQLQLFKAGHRGGSEYAHLMSKVVERMSDDQMKAVAAYFETRNPGM